MQSNCQIFYDSGDKHMNFPQNDIDSFLSSPAVLNKLRADFIETQSETAINVRKSINDSDIKTAHRLAHNLKSLAGLINENVLYDYAQTLEGILRNFSETANEIPAQALDDMENELARVVNRISQ